MPETLPPPIPFSQWPMRIVSAGLMFSGAIVFCYPWSRSRRAQQNATAPVPGSGEALAGDCAIFLEGVGKSYRSTTAIEDMRLSVPPGECVALWGSNGAGKTTALRCILGVIPYDGTIRVAGRDPATDGRATRRRIGYVPQDPRLYDDLTVDQTLRFFARLRRAPQTESVALLDRVGLQEHRDKPAGELSGGLKQRLALGIALLGAPPILLLDEPTANLDAQARTRFLDLLLELKHEGKTILFASHRVDEIEVLADRLVVLSGGRVSRVGNAGEVHELTGIRSVITIRLDPASIEKATHALRKAGHHAEKGERTLQVTVSPGERGNILNLLAEAGIKIADLKIEDTCA